MRVILLAAIIIVILLLAWGVYACVNGNGAPSPTSTPTPVPTLTPSPTPTGITPTPLPTPTPVPVLYYEIGQWVKSSQSLVNISAVERTKFYSTPGPVSAPAGTAFVFIDLTIVNTSSSTIVVQATDFSLVDSAALEYTPRILANSFYGAFPFTARILQPGATVSGKILYVVPDVSSGLEIQTIIDSYKLGWKLPY